MQTLAGVCHFRNQRGHLWTKISHLSSVLRIFHIWSSSFDWSGMLAASMRPSWDPSWLMLAASGSILFFSSSEKLSRVTLCVSSPKVMEFDGPANSEIDQVCHLIILNKFALFVLCHLMLPQRRLPSLCSSKRRAGRREFELRDEHRQRMRSREAGGSWPAHTRPTSSPPCTTPCQARGILAGGRDHHLQRTSW